MGTFSQAGTNVLIMRCQSSAQPSIRTLAPCEGWCWLSTPQLDHKLQVGDLSF